jgi:Tfp pilus assembly protein PilO
MTSVAQESFDEFDRLKAEADALGLQPPGRPSVGWTLQQLRREVADAKAAQQTMEEQRPAREAVDRFVAESGQHAPADG